jgi:hypothetical protein
MGHLLSGDNGNTMKRYRGEVGRDIGMIEINTIEEISERTFFKCMLIKIMPSRVCQGKHIMKFIKSFKHLKA